MKILISGGAGFIASNVTDAYLQDGHEVAIIDDLVTGFRENVNAQAKFYECDIRDADRVAQICDEFKPEVISHHAAQLDVRKAVSDPVYDASVNISGALNVLLHGARVGAHRIIFASSGGAVYGEPQFLPVTEDHPVAPESPYGLTKFTFEHYMRIWSQLHPITPVALRYANVYGPRQTAHGEAGVVAIFAGLLLDNKPCKIFGDGSMTRDYVFVGDVVEANRAALKRGDNDIINIGTGVETSTREVFDAVRAAVGTGPAEPELLPERPGEVHNICLDNSHAKEVLGWEPQVAFREGVQRTVEWHKQNENHG
ncbi:MAG: GDP-mannose 4,6-dehydratase [Abitibacteriaceae bacterium]|nr:GDP-mannose 4,6-dehydratase [Abditibacteriaceae bacterium]